MTDLPSRMRFVKEHNRKDFTRQILKFFFIMVDGYQCLLIEGDIGIFGFAVLAIF